MVADVSEGQINEHLRLKEVNFEFKEGKKDGKGQSEIPITQPKPEKPQKMYMHGLKQGHKIISQN